MMPDLGNKEYSDKTAETIDQEIRSLIDTAYSDTRTLLENRRREMVDLAEALLKYETLDAGEVAQIVEGKSLDKPTVGDLIDREHAKAGSAEAQGESETDAGQPKLPPLPEPG